MNTNFNLHRFGVNYVPSENWWYCWNDYHPDNIERDLDAIAALHADHIRIMLLWPYFQPNSGWVSPAHLDRLDHLMRAASARKLDVCVTLLNGWLTGLRFRPPFDQLDTFYVSTAMRDAQKIYFEAVASRMKEHSNFLGFDLGNEMNCCWQAASTDQGDMWSRWAIEELTKAAPSAVHVHGVDHLPWFRPATFSPGCLANLSPIIAIHAWIYFTGALKRGGPLDLPALHLPARMATLARAHASSQNKPVWIQEYGASELWMKPETIPVFLEKTTEHAIASGVNWFTWWASHDIQPSLKVNPLEYSLGLLTVENKEKPAAAVFRDIAKSFSGQPVATPRHELTALPEHNEEAVWKWLLEQS